MNASVHEGAATATATHSNEPRRPLFLLIAVPLVAWLAIGAQIYLRLHDRGVLHIWRVALDLSVLPLYLLLFFVAFKTLTRRVPASDGSFPTIAFLGIGLVPAWYLTTCWLGFADAGYLVWPMGVAAVFILVLVVVGSIFLSFSRHPVSFLSALGFMAFFVHWLAGSNSRSLFDDAGLSDEAKRRREQALSIDGFLLFVAAGLGGVVYLLAFLAKKGYGVHVAAGPTSLASYRDAAVGFISWHTLDLVPVIQIPETLNWKVSREFTGPVNDSVLLGLKVFIVFVVLKTVVHLWSERATKA